MVRRLVANRRRARWFLLVVLGALLPLFLWSRSGDALEDGRAPFRPDGLKAASRDRLALCVQGIDGATVDGETAIASVRTALQRAQRQPAWSILKISDGPAVVAYGCPLPPVLEPSGPVVSFMVHDLTSRRVDVASAYRVFLFVMREADVQRAFGTDTLYSRAANEEMLCAPAQTVTGERCQSVTTGVYLTQGELNDPAALEYAILRGLELTSIPTNLPHNPDIVPVPVRTP